jgi:hypothetical protein
MFNGKYRFVGHRLRRDVRLNGKCSISTRQVRFKLIVDDSVNARNYSGSIKLDRHLPYGDGSLIVWRYTVPRKVPVKLPRG